MKRIYLLIILLLTFYGGAKAQTFCFDTLYHTSNQFGGERDLVTIDWNNDGDMDYVVANTDSNKVYVHYKATGNRSFAPAMLQTVASLSQPYQIEKAFINGDAYEDLVVLHHGVGLDDSVRIFISDGIGGIANTYLLDAPYVHHLAVDDINSNGTTDLILSEYISSTGNMIYTYSGDGTGNFTPNQNFYVPYAVIKDITLADADGDGDNDWYVGSQDQYWDGSQYIDTSKVFVVTNNTVALSGSFAFNLTYSYTLQVNVDKRLTAIAASDFNGDNFADIAVTLDLSNKVMVLMNDGVGGYLAPVFYTVGNYPNSIACADMNGDAKQDIVVSLLYGGADIILVNNGIGDFPSTYTINNVPYYTKLLLSDMDNDGFPDILQSSANYNTPGQGVSTGIIFNNTNANIIINPINGGYYCPGDSAIVLAFSNSPGFQYNPTFDWGGLSTNDTIIHQINAFTTLSITMTSYNGCVINSFINLFTNPVPNVNLGSDIYTCNPNINIGVTSEPLTNYNWTTNPPGQLTSTSPMETVNPSSPVTYILTATETTNGCVASDSIVAMIYPSPTIVGLGTMLDVCEGLTLQLGDYVYPTGGTPPYSYNWFSGLNTYTASNPTHIATTSQNFTVTISDANGCVGTPGALLTNVRASTDTWGHISTESLPTVSLGSGLVYAFKYQPGSAGYDTVDIAGINASGDYAFFSLDSGAYLIKAILDTAVYSLSIPTYAGNTFQWDSSFVHQHNCTLQDTVNIQVLELPTNTGIGSISGFVIEEAGFGTGRLGPNVVHPDNPCVPGGPLKGIDVKLGKNPAGGIQARTTTDSTGHYQFDNLPLQGYRIYVDIPNLPMDSTREIVLDNINSTSVQNNYFADSNSVYVNPNYVGIYASANVYENNFTIFPNPAIDNLFISLNLHKTGDVNIELSNSLGEIIKEEKMYNQLSGTQNYNFNIASLNLKAGVYFISIVNENKRYTQRLVVIE